MTPLKIRVEERGKGRGIVTPHPDSKDGMVGKFSVAAHPKAIEKTELITGNVWEVLTSHDITVTAYQKWPLQLTVTSYWVSRTNELEVNRQTCGNCTTQA